MAPVPRPGRNKIALLQSRRKSKQPLSRDQDYPEDIADLVGNIDFWLKAIKAFRWHDEQQQLHDEHYVTHQAIANIFSIDRSQVSRFLQKYRVRTPNTYRGQLPWKELRWAVVQKILHGAMSEIVEMTLRVEKPEPTQIL